MILDFLYIFLASLKLRDSSQCITIFMCFQVNLGLCKFSKRKKKCRILWMGFSVIKKCFYFKRSLYKPVHACIKRQSV